MYLNFSAHIANTATSLISTQTASKCCYFNYLVSMILAILILFLSCSPPPATDPFVFRNDAIQIDLRADHMLNAYDGETHSVKLAIYQLTDNVAFHERSKNDEGIRDLLRVHKFDQSVVSYEKFIVKPNDSRLLILDRIAGAKWIGIVAGYYSPQGDFPPIRILEIPSRAKRKSLFRRFGEFTGFMTPYENRYIPTLLIQLVFTPETMYETSIFR